MNVIRHDYPGDEFITLTVEIEKRRFDHLSDLGDVQPTRPNPLVQRIFVIKSPLCIPTPLLILNSFQGRVRQTICEMESNELEDSRSIEVR